MPTKQPVPAPKTISLAAGAQAVINGALVTALESCQFEVGSGAYVLTGRALWRSQRDRSSSADALYFEMMKACAAPENFEPARSRLFAALSEVVAQDRTHQSQKECAACAAALVAGDAEAALGSARRLAEANAAKAKRTPSSRGAPAQRRAQIVSSGTV